MIIVTYDHYDMSGARPGAAGALARSQFRVKFFLKVRSFKFSPPFSADYWQQIEQSSVGKHTQHFQLEKCSWSADSPGPGPMTRAAV